MLFNSLDFVLFLPLVFIIYWFLGSGKRSRNIILVLASYIFYGWWDWRFLGLIFFSTALDYAIGHFLEKEGRDARRKGLLFVSIVMNLGLLAFFKYYNFFVDNFVAVFSFAGSQFSVDRLNIILPVGISFYTFQTLSYTIDVYRRKLEPSKDFIAFMAFVSFFPQLVAGPIERATNLLGQFSKKQEFSLNKAVDGCRQILWGFVKKLIIADNCASIVNQIFDNHLDHSGSMLILGAVLFAFQIYCDFSGYSDIAIGTARLFGFSLMKNFAFPYFSRDMAEFWRRWHISLSTWFRDYLYIPLGGNKGSRGRVVRNVFIIFIVSGFWHGAKWTFLAWGALNALYFIPLLLLGRNRNHLEIVAGKRFFPKLKELISVLITFLLTSLAWIFFRAEDLAQAISYISRIFQASFFITNDFEVSVLTFALPFFIIVEWLGRHGEYAIEHISRFRTSGRWLIYYVLLLSIYFFGTTSNNLEFIYFQF